MRQSHKANQGDTLTKTSKRLDFAILQAGQHVPGSIRVMNKGRRLQLPDTQREMTNTIEVMPTGPGKKS